MSPAAAGSRGLDRSIAALREELAERIRSGAATGDPAQVQLDRAAADLVESRAGVLAPDVRELLVRGLLKQTRGFGPLEELLEDPAVEEILVNGPGHVYAERAGRLELTGVRFEGEEELRDLIERILAPLGRRADELNPIADGRLPDGSRVNVVLPPLAVDGPTLAIRRFRRDRPGAIELRDAGTLPVELFEQLHTAVIRRRSILISGGTGSGKTTVLGALCSFLDPGERLITIEDAAELDLGQPHVVRLESRPPSVEGKGEVTIRGLVRNALRMRPDRLIIGEVRGAEAFDLIVALNTGHRGSLSTIHANDPLGALRRLETLAMTAAVGVRPEAIRSQLAAALDLVLHLERGEGGARLAVSLSEVRGGAEGLEAETRWARSERE